MNIISIDLPWKEDKKGHRTLATTDLDGNVKIAPASDDNELLQLVRDTSEPRSIILIDIPIDGFDNLVGEHFRPIDRAIARQGISALPASIAGKGRGKSLKGLLEKDKNRLIVYETYPYAIYKFLAYLQMKKSLQRLNLDKFDTLLDKGFRAYWPPKYKREKRNKNKRIEYMRFLYSLLKNNNIGLKFCPSDSLRYPEDSYSRSKLDRLCDEYDACLGAVVGIYFANNSSYACIAGDSKSGNILLLADQWLAAQLDKEVKITKPKGSSKI